MQFGGVHDALVRFPIRRAVDRASRSGALPPIELDGMTPVQQCEAIARVIYNARAKHQKFPTV